MSYSRWSGSEWYAFAMNFHDERGTGLALWHCEADVHPTWTIDEIRDADEYWLREKYPMASDDDRDEAQKIIKAFLNDYDMFELTNEGD